MTTPSSSAVDVEGALLKDLALVVSTLSVAAQAQISVNGQGVRCTIHPTRAKNAVAVLERVLAYLAALPKGGGLETIEACAKYLDDLAANMLRNDADMQLDECDDPQMWAEKLRALSPTVRGDEGRLPDQAVSDTAKALAHLIRKDSPHDR